MHRFIPYGRQSISEADIAAVAETLRSDFLTQGPRVDEFEAKIAEFVGARYAVAVNTATSALHLAVLALGVGPGDRVVTSPNTFLASANCAAFAGASPAFSDIDSKSYCIDPDVLRRNWHPSNKTVVAVDYAGQACDLPAISELARARGAFVIDDASHAIGTSFFHERKRWNLGANPWADITVFSFHPVKTMTTGEGGMLLTNNEEWANRARRIRSHGIERSNFIGLGAPDDSELSERGPWYYEMQELGFNYRITDLQCALGLSQLTKLEFFAKRRREIVERYNNAFSGLSWLKTPELKDTANKDVVSWHLYTVQIDFRAIERTRTQIMGELRKEGVGTQVLYIPVHLQPWYRKTYGYGPGMCPVAENFYRRALSLPLFPAMSDQEVENVIQAVFKVVGIHR